MEEPKEKLIHIIDEIVKRSLFTHKQFSIIYNIHHDKHNHKNISSGAYFRQVKQCKEKIIRLHYSILLLEILGILDANTFSLLQKTTQALTVILSKESSDVCDFSTLRNVINTLDEIFEISLNQQVKHK